MRTKLVIAAVATAGAVSAVGASAFTASISGGDPTKLIGYTTTAISGAAMPTPPVLHYSTGLDKISTIDVVLTGDTTASTLSVNRNAGAPVTCVAGTVASGQTPYTCTVNFDIDGMTTIGYALQ
jgi:hypothetical protein